MAVIQEQDSSNDEATADPENGTSSSNAPSGSAVVLYRGPRFTKSIGISHTSLDDEPDWENDETLSLERLVEWANSQLEVVKKGEGKEKEELVGGEQAAKASISSEKNESEDPEKVKVFKTKIAEETEEQKNREYMLKALARKALKSLENRSGNSSGSTRGTTAQAEKCDRRSPASDASGEKQSSCHGHP